jgi:hypothetical protein
MYVRVNDVPTKEDFITYQRDGSLNIKAFNKSFSISDDDSKKISLPIFIGVFILITLLLTVVFFFFASSDKKFIYALAGFGLGVVISILIWVFWGKDNYKLV